MALTNEQIQELYSKFIELGHENRDSLGNFGKQDLKDAIAAVDQWITGNQTSYNQALPEPCKSELTAKQKVLLFFYVANKRWEVI